MAEFPFDKNDIALMVGLVFLAIFAGLVIYIISGADLTGITITGAIDVNYVFGIFTGIVIAFIGFIGITRGKTPTNGSGTTP